MDYLPPERPALIAKANEQSEAARAKAVYEFVDLGMIKTMPDPGDWSDTTSYEERQLLHQFKPGQRVVFAKPESDAEPVMYINQHKPCSQTAFTAFQSLLKTDSIHPLTGTQLISLSEILGSKVKGSALTTDVMVEKIGGKQTLSVYFMHHKEKRVDHSLFLIFDAKKRLIQEVGFEGAKGNTDHWRKEAEDMLLNVKFKPE